MTTPSSPRVIATWLLLPNPGEIQRERGLGISSPPFRDTLTHAMRVVAGWTLLLVAVVLIFTFILLPIGLPLALIRTCKSITYRIALCFSAGGFRSSIHHGRRWV
jgi:hypothetical protein